MWESVRFGLSAGGTGGYARASRTLSHWPVGRADVTYAMLPTRRRTFPRASGGLARRLPAAVSASLPVSLPVSLPASLLVALPVSLLLGGCLPQYRVPTGAPSATVRLLTTTDDNTVFTVADPAGCPTPTRPRVLAGTGKQLAAMGREPSLGMAGASPEPPSRTRERKVEAGHRVYIAVSSSAAPPAPEMRCAAGVSFVPQPGGQYEIRFARDDAASVCSARVLRVEARPEGGAALFQETSQQGFRALRRDYICERPAD